MIDSFISTTSRQLKPRPIGFKNNNNAVIGIIGASGTIGTITAHQLQNTQFKVVGLDFQNTTRPELFDSFIVGDLNSRSMLIEYLNNVDYVINSTTGAKEQWAGLQQVEISGTVNLLAACLDCEVRKVITLSSNHVSGLNEIDKYSYPGVFVPSSPTDASRPDGLYACAKVFVESVSRYFAEVYGLPNSVIRIGAMRLVDEPSKVENGPRFPNMSEEQYVDRMKSVWLSHEQWKKILIEEINSDDYFRLRYGSDYQSDAPWTEEIEIWNP